MNLASCAKRRKKPPSPTPCSPPASRFRTPKRKSPNMNAKKAKRSRTNGRRAASIWATRTAERPGFLSLRFFLPPAISSLSYSLQGGSMQRSLFAVAITALAAIATLGGLAFVWAAPNPHKAASRAEGDWRILDPVVYENIAIFPVVSGSSQDTSSFLTLEEGLASGEVIVSERGTVRMVRNRDGVHTIPDYSASASVNQLVLINRSKRPLLLLAGELVSGGKQDRIIGKDRIVPVGAEPLPLDVFCVEHGRWTGSSSQFTAAKTIVHPSVREQAAVDQKQTEVWAAVSGGTMAGASGSPSARNEIGRAHV